MHLNHAVDTTVVLHHVVLHTGTAGITIRICTVHLRQDFPYGFTHRTHGNYYVLWIFSTVIQERAGEKNTAQNDVKQTDTAAEVPVIDENAALHAKEWVDNGSRL